MGEEPHDEIIRKPLIPGENSTADDNWDGNEAGGKARSRGINSMVVYLSTFVAVCGSYEIGAMKGYSSPAESGIINDIGLTAAEYSVFGSILNIGAMVGAITSGTIADLVGRKWAMGIYSCFCAGGWLSIFFAQGTLALDIGRLAGGYGIGAFSYVVPVYIAEITPVHSRGVLTALHQVLLCAGVAASYFIGLVLPWRGLAVTGLIPCAIQILGLLLIPESPRWLARRGAMKQFIDSLHKLRGKDADVSEEASDIHSYMEELEEANLQDLFQRRYLKSIKIGIGLMAIQEFSGISGLCFYATEVFESAGVSSTVGSILFASVQVVINIIVSALVDKAGRKPLVLLAATGLTLGCLITATSFLFKAHELWMKGVPVLALTGIMVYIASFSAGMGAVPFIITSEIFPMNIKGTAGSLAALVNWFFAWAVSYTFSFLMSWSSYGTFLLYAVINGLGILFVMKVVPETKGRTLERIQAEINS